MLFIPTIIRCATVAVWLAVSLAALAAGSAESDAVVEKSRFRKLYNHYFPTDAKNVTSMYRVWFDRNLLEEGGRERLGKQEKSLHRAMRGDHKAFRAFVRSKFRDADGEFGENWNYECVLLLLVLEDTKFASLLAKEDVTTIRLVGEALNMRMNWRMHPFPRTQRVLSGTRYPHGQ